MSYFVVAGMPECCLYNHVRLIADILSDNFPNFKVQFILREPDEWKTWIKNINLSNGWYHLSSPIIWKELTMRGGNKHLIGGASEFWEYCYDYYNLESLLDNKELYKLVADMKQYLENKKLEEELRKSKEEKMIICIDTNNDTERILPILLFVLSQNLEVFYPKEVIIKIINAEISIDDDIDIKLLLNKIEFVDSLEKSIEDADLLILAGDYTRNEGEELFKWLQRNKRMMVDIADIINTNAKTTLRVIVAVNGPVCFNTTILIDNITKIHLHNIVAETSSKGLEVLSLASKMTNMPMENLYGPPVWGFIGLNQLIDLEHVIQRYDVYRPNVRAVKNNYRSTLVLGKRHTELRFLSYLNDKFKSIWIKLKHNVNESVNNCSKFQTAKHSVVDFDKDTTHSKMSRYAKVRGIVALIKVWYAQEPHKNIISVGIMSNGTFGIPPGVVFSQPVMLKNNRFTPVNIFPIPRKDPCGVEDLIPFALEICKYFRVRLSRASYHYFQLSS